MTVDNNNTTGTGIKSEISGPPADGDISIEMVDETIFLRRDDVCSEFS